MPGGGRSGKVCANKASTCHNMRTGGLEFVWLAASAA